MNPFLTPRGRWLLALGLLFCLVGAIARQPLLILLGQIPIVLLAVSIFMGLPAAIALDRRLIRLRIHPEHEPEATTTARTTHVAGDEIPLQLEITNHTPVHLHGIHATPFASGSLEFADSGASFVEVLPGSQAHLAFTLRTRRAGRHAVQGFDLALRDPLGLIETIDYLPANHVFECYPAVGRMRRPSTPRTLKRQVSEQSGLPGHKFSPSGADIRELRDYHPGEPLKNIAWKASARARKLIARNFDNESAHNLYILLDISSTMRASHKLERAIEVTAELAQAHAGTRHPLGLITFDERIYAHIPAGKGPANLRQILNHLTTLDSITDRERTEPDDAELERFVTDYLLIQERLDFRIQTQGKVSVNSELLERWLNSILPRERARFATSALNHSEDSPVRQFLQLRAIPVPYRSETRLGLKERSLAEAIELLTRTSSAPQHIIVVTDLIGVTNLELLTRLIRLTRIKGHHLEILIPSPAGSSDKLATAKSEHLSILKELFTATEAEEQRRIRNHLQAHAVPTYFMQS